MKFLKLLKHLLCWIKYTTFGIHVHKGTMSFFMTKNMNAHFLALTSVLCSATFLHLERCPHIASAESVHPYWAYHFVIGHTPLPWRYKRPRPRHESL